MKKTLILVAVLFMAMTNQAQASEKHNAKLLSDIKNHVIKHSPYKIFNPKTKKYNKRVLRTPGAACESINFLSSYYTHVAQEKKVYNKIVELADWTISIQEQDNDKVNYGGVPSTPDLPAPHNDFYYAIDTAFCGKGFLDAYRVTEDKKYFEAAEKSAAYLRTLQTPYKHISMPRKMPKGGFCEYTIGKNGAWNCAVYAKNLIALSFYKDMAEVTGDDDYIEYGEELRDVLIAGLRGAWEFGDIKGKRIKWKRVDGPNKEPNHFVYGDTIAYALKGLHDFEGLSDDVKEIYEYFAGFKSEEHKNYDGRIAFAGYIVADEKSPDNFSAYYDVVTLGILSKLRHAGYPEDVKLSQKMLDKLDVNTMYWNRKFDLSILTDDAIDVSTIVNVGEALIHLRGKQ